MSKIIETPSEIFPALTATTAESFEALFNKVERFNWTFSVIVKVYSVLVHSKTELELYSGLCNSMTSQNGFSLAWIGVPIDDDKKSVEILASAGNARSYLDGIRVSWGDNKNGNGPAGRAIRTGKIQFFNNMLNSRLFAPWMERAKELNLQSSFSLPIKLSTGQVVATLTVYSEQAHAFYKDELKLLDQLNADLGYCIESLRSQFPHENALSMVPNESQ